MAFSSIISYSWIQFSLYKGNSIKSVTIYDMGLFKIRKYHESFLLIMKDMEPKTKYAQHDQNIIGLSEVRATSQTTLVGH